MPAALDATPLQDARRDADQARRASAAAASTLAGLRTRREFLEQHLNRVEPLAAALGEITSIEAICEGFLIYTVVRGYEKAHRLQRAKRTRTFVNMTDSDIATQVARNAGLTIGDVQSTSVTHDHIAGFRAGLYQRQRHHFQCAHTEFVLGHHLRRPTDDANRDGGAAGGRHIPR